MDYRVNNLLYAAGPELLNTIRMDIVLKEPVDLQTAMLIFRHYYRHRISRDDMKDLETL